MKRLVFAVALVASIITPASAGDFITAGPAPYGSAALGVKFWESLALEDRCYTSQDVDGNPRTTTTMCGGSNPVAQFEIGVEMEIMNRVRVDVGWQHTSHLRDGWPFNSNIEQHMELLFVRTRFGGLR